MPASVCTYELCYDENYGGSVVSCDMITGEVQWSHTGGGNFTSDTVPPQYTFGAGTGRLTGTYEWEGGIRGGGSRP